MGSKPGDDFDNNDDIFNKDIHEEQAENKYAGRIYIYIPGSDELWSGKQLQFKCEECESSYKTKKSLNLHTYNKHEGIVHSCHYCGYNTTNKSHLKKHIESVHKGLKYKCSQCNYHATRQYILKNLPIKV